MPYYKIVRTFLGTVAQLAILFALSLIFPGESFADSEKHNYTGFLDFNVYPYTHEKSDNSFTLNILANLENDVQYFSLNNFGRDTSHSELEDFESFLSEQNLRWRPSKELPFQLTAQALIRSGQDNDALRLGVRWSAHQTPVLMEVLSELQAKYWVNIHGAQFDHLSGYQWQIEHVFRLNVLPAEFDNRVYLGGFADHNINHADGTKGVWVEETQLGVRLLGNFYAIAEQRYNGFRKGRESSLGLGIEYLVSFN